MNRAVPFARRVRLPIRFAAGRATAAILLVALVACGDTAVQQPTPTPSPEPERVVTEAVAAETSTPTPQPTPEATPEPTPEATPQATAEPEPELTGLERVEQATVQIVAQGTFVDPQIGVVQNAAGSGSGFIISADGIAVTNNHVVTGAASLNVQVAGQNRSVNARVLGASECWDLAVIDLAGDGYLPLMLSDVPLRVGTPIFVAGYPLGEPEFTLVNGIVAKLDAPGATSWASVDHVFQHDALANPGNSGGPVVTAAGDVVGVHYSGRRDANQGFAISAEQARPIIERLADGEQVDWIGINGSAVATADGSLTGIWVASVESGSPADVAGIRPGDVVTELERLTMAADGTMEDYCDVLRTRGSDAVMNVTVMRIETDEILVGQINGRPLESATDAVADAEPTPTAPPSPTPAPAPTAPPPDDLTDLIEVVDDTAHIALRAPAAWSLSTDPGTGWAAISGAPDLNAWWASQPGLVSRHFPPFDGAEPGESRVADANGFTVTLLRQHEGVLEPDETERFLAAEPGPENCTVLQPVQPWRDGFRGGHRTLSLCERADGATGVHAIYILSRSDEPSYLIWLEFVAFDVDEFAALRAVLDTVRTAPVWDPDARPIPYEPGDPLATFIDEAARIELPIHDAWQVELTSLDGAPAINAAPDLDAWFDSFPGLPSRHTPPLDGPLPGESEVVDAIGVFVSLPLTDPSATLSSEDLNGFLDARPQPTNCPPGIRIQIGPDPDAVQVGNLRGAVQIRECENGLAYDVWAVTQQDQPWELVWIETVLDASTFKAVEFERMRVYPAGPPPPPPIPAGDADIETVSASDETGRIHIDMPHGWTHDPSADVEGNPTIVAAPGEHYLRFVDLAQVIPPSGADATGIFVNVGPQAADQSAATSADFDAVIDFNGIATGCTFASRQDVDGPVFIGKIQFATCLNGALHGVQALALRDQPTFIIVVITLSLTPDDLNVLVTMLNSMTIDPP